MNASDIQSISTTYVTFRNSVELSGIVIGQVYNGQTRRGNPKLQFSLAIPRTNGRPKKFGPGGEQGDVAAIIAMNELAQAGVFAGAYVRVRGYFASRVINGGGTAQEFMAESLDVYRVVESANEQGSD